MSGIAGWVEFNNSLPTTPDVAANMAATFTRHDGGKQKTMSDAEFAIVLAALNEPSDIYSDAGVAAAVFGSLRFTDPELATLSQDEGAAKALVDGFRRYRVALLQRMVGHFSFAVVMKQEKEALIAADRFGVH